MADEPSLTKAQIKRIITEEVRNAAKTQLADSTNRQNPISDQFGPGITLSIDKFTLSGIFIPADAATAKIVSDLQKLGKPKKPVKKSRAEKKQ